MEKLSWWSKPNWWITEILNDKRDLLQILQVIKYFGQTLFITGLLICNVAQQESREEKNMLRLRRNVKIIWKMCGQITGGRTHWGKTETFFPILPCRAAGQRLGGFVVPNRPTLPALISLNNQTAGRGPRRRRGRDSCHEKMSLPGRHGGS